MHSQDEEIICSFLKHPFGREHEVSKQQLLTAFNNHLYLGQWELAKACLISLRENKEPLDNNIKDVLLSISQNSKLYSVGSSSIQSPHHLSWLCLEELKYHIQDEEFLRLQNDFEFRLLLAEANEYTNKEVIQDLYKYRKKLLCHSEIPEDKKLPQRSLQFLRYLLHHNAYLAKTIISSLISCCDSRERTPEIFENLFIDSITHYLKLLKEQSLKSRSNQTEFNKNEFLKNIHAVYSLFSIMDINVSKCQFLLQNIFKDIITLANGYHKIYLNNGIVYLSLLRSTNTALIEEFCYVEDDYLGRHYSEKTKSIIEDTSVQLFKYSKAFVKAAVSSDRKIAWRELCLQAVKNDVHFLQNLIDHAVHLVKISNFSELQMLLEPSEFHPLKALVLLLGWGHVHSLSNAQQLLDSLGTSKLSYYPLLEQSCHKLAYQLELVRWCLEQTAPMLEASSALHQRVSEMFQSLESHSILYMLHHCTNLARLNEDDVFSLLKKSPVPTDPVLDCRREKLVRFVLEEPDSFDMNDEDKVLSLEQFRDCSIFRSYRIIKLVMDAINTSVNLEFNYKNSDQRRNSNIRSSLSTDVSSSDIGTDQEILVSIEDFKEGYNEFVIKRLETAQKHLKQLYPLTYRVEILENLFSLLFVQSNDMQECASLINSDSGEEGYREEYDRCRRGSLDLTDDLSFNTSLIETTEQINCVPEEIIEETSAVFVQNSSDTVLNPSFKINKTILKDSLSHSNSKSISYDYTSSLSNCSSSGNFKIGFLCNEYIVRDILTFLQNSLDDLNIARFPLNTQNINLANIDPNEDFRSNQGEYIKESHLQKIDYTDTVHSSVLHKHLNQNITRLMQYVSEAQWRFHLVANSSVPLEFGKIGSTISKIASVEDDIGVISWTDKDEHFRSRRKNSSSIDRDLLVMDTIHKSDVETIDNRTRKKRRRHRSREGSRSLLKQTSYGIIFRMLAPQEALLNLCLRHNNFGQAQQVVQMFKMEDTTSVLEVKFAGLFEKTRKKVQSLENRTKLVPISSMNQDDTVGLKSTIANAAAAGKASTNLTLEIDDLLSTCQPKLPSYELSLVPLQLLPHFIGNVPAMIIFDLAITSCKTIQGSKSLLNMVQKRFNSLNLEGHEKGFSGSETSSIATDVHLKGFENFFKQLSSLMQSNEKYGIKDGILPLLLTSTESLEFSNKKLLSVSLQEIEKMFKVLRKELSNGKNLKCPSDVNATQQSVEVEKQISRQFLPLTNLAEINKSHLKSNKETPASQENISFNKSKKHTLDSSVHAAMKQLSQACNKYIPANGILYHLFQSKTKKMDKLTIEYALSLYQHVKRFAKLVTDCETEQGVINTVYSQNYFLALSKCPSSTIGKLMFVRNIPPDRLHILSEKHHLNLVQVIAQYCCPVIPTISRTAVLTTRSSNVLLNSGSCIACPAQKPEVMVRKLLSKLIDILQDFTRKTQAADIVQAQPDLKITTPKDISTTIFTIDAVELLLQSEDWKELQHAMVELIYVDLDLLETNEEKLCFFINLLNLMWCHALLNRMTLPQKRLKRSFSHSLSLSNSVEGPNSQILPCFQSIFKMPFVDIIHFLKRRCYNVGQLGLISLFDLHFHILRIGILSPTFQRDFFLQECCGLSKFDPWMKYVPIFDPRVIFTITYGCLSSPPLQVFTPELLNQALDETTVKYISINTSVNIRLSEICIPQLISWFYQCSEQSGMDLPTTEFHDRLSQLIALRGSHQLQAELQPFFIFSETDDEIPVLQVEKKKDFVIKINPFNFEFGYTFSHLPSNEQLAASSSVTDLSTVFKAPPCMKEDVFKAKLSSDLIEFLKNQNSLPATLASVIIPHEDEDCDGFTIVQCPWDFEHVKEGRNLSALLQFINSHPMCGLVFRDLISSDICPRGLLGCVLALSSYQGKNMDCYIKIIMDQLCELRMWHELLQLLENFLPLRKGDNQCFYDYMDLFLCKLAGSDTQTAQPKKPWTFAKLIRNPEVRVRCILKNLEYWPVDVCVEALEMCLSSGVDNYSLTTGLETALKHIKIFQKSLSCLQKSLLALKDKLNISSDDDGALPTIFQNWNSEHWPNVIELSKNQPIDVLRILLECQEYNLAREWSELFHIANQKKWEIEESYVVYLLESNPPDTAKAYQVLESLFLEDKKLTLQTCGCLLQRLTSHSNILFVAQFALDYLRSELTEDQEDCFCLKYIGAKGLLCLPEGVQRLYQHLAERPILLLEQLLMNMKIDWADTVFQNIQDDCKLLHNIDLGVTVDSFDSLLLKYANFALDCPAAKTIHIDTAGRQRSMSRNTLLSSFSTSTTIGSIPIPITSSPMLMGPIRSLPSELLKFEDRNKQLALASGLTSSYSTRKFSQSIRISSTPTSVFTGPFIMPSLTPNKANWVPDSEVSVCMVCKIEQFSMFNRRHHCRRCGRVVCAGCSKRSARVPDYGEVPVRTCDECFELMFSQKPWATSIWSGSPDILEQKLRAKLTTMGSSPTIPSSETSSVEEMMESDIDVGRDIWRLEVNDANNATLRGEFFYEQAPSVSLCLSILNIHSNPLQCGRHMLQFCDDLSTFLQPVAPGVANPEVDYSLVISMMRTLLFNAKLKFIKANEGVELCDTYMSHVDLLNLLVSSNCKDIPSIHELTQIESARRLQNRLIEDERLSLAMEVSTKCGLDVSGIWAAWGMTYLRSGDFASARKKFSHCLKPPLDLNQGQLSKTLEDIIDYLEKPIGRIPGKVTLSPLKDLITDPLILYPSESHIDEKNFQECLYYLHTYGIHLAIVSFYRRHGLLQKALQYISEKMVTADVFIEGLLIPSLKYAEFSKLEDQLIMFDPTLNKWSYYLMSSCRYLNKKNMINVLYKLQIFIKDHIRAAMTCIKFFEKGANTYEDLYNRLHYLQSAEHHLYDYLQKNQMSSSTKHYAKFDSSSLRLLLSNTEVNKHVNTIKLQIEVTNFMHKTSASASKMGSNVDKAVTLFGNFKTKTELMAQIILAYHNLDDGFTLSFKIIQEFRLNAMNIYKEVVKDLAKHNRHKEIRQFFQCIKDAGIYTEQNYDEVMMTCIMTFIKDSSEPRDVESYIKMLKSEENKIEMFILSGKLKSAYLIAVKEKSSLDVKRIAKAAEKAGQTAVKQICDKWLAADENKQRRAASTDQIMSKK